MNDLPLIHKTVLVTGAARRLGRIFALACSKAGANIVIHHGDSDDEAEQVSEEIEQLGQKAWIFKGDLNDAAETRELITRINAVTQLDALVNSAAIFEALTLEQTQLEDWERHLAINLTAPFLLSQAFVKQIHKNGRIVNILDWRALRPGPDHFPYTVSKAALAAMTKSMASAVAPKVQVNGLALGAILPPADGKKDDKILERVPMKRWATEQEVEKTLIFLLTAPTYITGEIVHLDGGRHLL